MESSAAASARARIQTLAGHLLSSNTVSGDERRSCPGRGIRQPACPFVADSSKAWPLINTNPSKVSTTPPLKVVITGAAGQIAYSLVFMIARGNMFGPHQPISLYLLDIPKMVDALKGVVMELQDCALPLVQGIVATDNLKEAFLNAHVILMVGAFPRGPGMERKDLLKQNVAIFKEQGAAIDQYASRNVKVLVVGDPANTNCLAAMSMAPSIPPRNFSALTRLDHNRAQAQVALKVGVPVHRVHNVVIWGNHSNTQFPDTSNAYINHYPQPGLTTPVRAAVNDDQWIKETFIPIVQQRGAAVIKARKLSSAASAATAVVGHMRSWLMGTRDGEVVSMAVPSDGSYGVPEGLIYSFPVTCKEGEFTIVQGFSIDGFAKTMLDTTTKELVEERALAFEFLGIKH